MINIKFRIIDKDHCQDINIPNQPFQLFGRMIPSYVNEEWSYTTETFDQVEEMCFPDENYNFNDMKREYVFIGAYIEQQCVGLAILKHNMFKYMYLYDLKVKQEFRSLGIAKQLMFKVKEVALSYRYIGIYTQAQDNNLAACLFYLKCGFIIGGMDCKVYQGTSQEHKKDIYFYWDF